MKKTLLFVFIAFITNGVISQEKKDDNKNNIKTINFIDGNSEDVPFTIIDKAPIFPGCEKYETNSQKKYCLNKMMRSHVAKNFNIDLINCLEKKEILNNENGKKEKQCISVLSPGFKRIYLQFKINKKGKVVDISARAPHEKLKEEAIRIAKLLPVMTPGSHKNKNVKVGYTLPITFNVE
ncbi:energy transducer TonB [Tenacibaculum aiptasiae]|uniref:energy transducer TonB n=1 Tax=Tenacibaculum aiptasiae TaxID=426481 RepID=UPI003B5C6414